MYKFKTTNIITLLRTYNIPVLFIYDVLYLLNFHKTKYNYWLTIMYFDFKLLSVHNLNKSMS